MPRIAEGRAPARPVSSGQKERRQRMLRAAARIGSELPLERVQMHDVAREAGVAIATLYRYFPSKHHLFSAIVRAQVDRLSVLSSPVEPGGDPAEAVYQMLLRASRTMLERPRLAMAMLLSNNQISSTPEGREMARRFQELILDVAGLDPEDARNMRRVRLIEQGWYGVLISVLNGYTTAEEGELDLRLAVHLLLAPHDPIPDSPDALTSPTLQGAP